MIEIRLDSPIETAPAKSLSDAEKELYPGSIMKVLVAAGILPAETITHDCNFDTHSCRIVDFNPNPPVTPQVFYDDPLVGRTAQARFADEYTCAPAVSSDNSISSIEEFRNALDGF